MRPRLPEMTWVGQFVQFFGISAALSAIVVSLIAPSSGSAQFQQYQRTLESLSEPPEVRWQQFGPPYFSTNEKLLNRFYSRFDDAGGVTVGVSFQQNLSLLVHARPRLCVI